MNLVLLNTSASGEFIRKTSSTSFENATPGSSSGAGVPVTPTGNVNGSNRTFIVTEEPKYVVSDGITYFSGAGYSYSALSITMDIGPSSYIRYFL